ncbi:tubulin monoglycylase TTLL3-like [Stegastes partitus]|uniref:Tubulin monoglycylase TTLL3-like n=1 Tax=Stegastes partitus TaxID=144197 RepID=A0A9Y4JWA8_9TELE|nr:PREDICTED: tubulin monoglycylase TTLL3-like [Stegastes partitus]
MEQELRAAKAFVHEAVKMHKIFSVQGSNPVVRAALRARGWVELRNNRSTQQAQQHCHKSRGSSNGASDNDDNAEKEQDPDRQHSFMSRQVKNEMVYFYWTYCREAINTKSLHKEQITNHFADSRCFTTKVGLCMNLRNLHWFDSTDPDTFFPRCYILGAHEKQDFIEDFRRTACTSLLKYIAEREQDFQGERRSLSIQAIKGQEKQSKQRCRPVVLSQMINSALKVCQQLLDSLEHKDIDMNSETLTQEEWTEFIDNYYLVVHGGAEIEKRDNLVTSCKAMLHRLEEVSPQLDIDGMDNIWIIKPGAKSRGRDIKCSKHLDRILGLVDNEQTLFNINQWVVQKYLERPLLVHDTKFDVRQWFLVTDWNPLTVWFYKKCYMRFSTQPYSLDILDSSVHLCNDAIQKHLKPSQQRHPDIPAHNMWSDEQFRTFLSSQNQEAQWETVVVQGMKKAVIHVVQTAQDLMDSHKNSFEVYGADFLLGHDLHPWLLEINASPDMSPSTPVTARLCAAVQEDTLKVVLDWRVDHTANTGDFELIYRQAAVEVPQYTERNLSVRGFAIKSPCSLPPLTCSSCSPPRHQRQVKSKDPVAEKVKHLPAVQSAETQLKNTSSEVPVGHQPHSVVLCKSRAEVSKLCSGKVQLFTTDKHQDLSVPVKITAPEQSRQAVISSSRA